MMQGRREMDKVRCKECGWEGDECELDYHFANDLDYRADWTTCPECGSENSEEM